MGFGAGPGFSYPSVSFDAPSISVDDASLGIGLGATGGVDSSGIYSPSVSADQAAQDAATLALARSLTGPPIPATLEIPNTTMNTTDPVVAARLGGAAARAQALEDYQQAQKDAMAAALVEDQLSTQLNYNPMDIGAEAAIASGNPVVGPSISPSMPPHGRGQLGQTGQASFPPEGDFGNPDMDMISPSIPEKRIIPATTPDSMPGQVSGMGGAGSYDEKRARMRLLGINADPYAGHRYMAGGGQV
jgi:hypothetical protein|tara:strand:+ start:443 stop:1180 length:738 start_codon:yes stop_codon:yes gene_type:complete